MWRKLFGAISGKSNDKANNSNTRDIWLDTYLQQKQEKQISLLLLGPNGSGKSTILHQIEKIYYGKLPNKILKDASQYIKWNILEDIYDLSRENEILMTNHKRDSYLSSLISNNYLKHISIKLNIYIPFEIINIINKYYYYCLFELNAECQIICNQIKSLKGGHLEETELTPQFAKKISILWNDKGLQETFNIRKLNHHMENTPYFMNMIHRISQPNYIATFEDYTRVRHRTCGIIEIECNINNDDDNKKNEKCINLLKVTDVGGCRTERKKWLRCFSDTNALMYVMSLDGYNKTLFVDHTQNCYIEAFNVFEQTCNYLQSHYPNILIIVILNKYDLFVEKIKTVPFTVFEKEFDQNLANDTTAIINYVQKEFKKRYYNLMKSEKSQKIQFHITNAIDTDQIKCVIQQVQAVMIKEKTLFGTDTSLQ